MRATRRLAADGGERPSSPGRRSGWVMLAQPDPGDAGAGGEQPRQRRDASCPADRCAPNRSRCSSMNAQINGAVGRIAARRKLLQPLVFRRQTQAHNFSGVTCGSRGLHRGDPGCLTGVDLGLAHPIAQRLRVHPGGDWKRNALESPRRLRCHPAADRWPGQPSADPDPLADNRSPKSGSPGIARRARRISPITPGAPVASLPFRQSAYLVLAKVSTRA
jgi:hypothetical protein